MSHPDAAEEAALEMLLPFQSCLAGLLCGVEQLGLRGLTPYERYCFYELRGVSRALSAKSRGDSTRRSEIRERLERYVSSGVTTCVGIQISGYDDLSTGLHPSKRGSEVPGQSSVTSTNPRADRSSTAIPPSTTSHCGPNTSDSMSSPETAPSTAAVSRSGNSRTYGSEGELIQHMRASCGRCGDRKPTPRDLFGGVR